jgi:polyisoprenoid-binding protein YceI
MVSRTLLAAVITFFGLSWFAGNPSASLAADVYTVDPMHSSLVFRAKHLDVSYVYGRFNSISGTINIDEKDPANNAFEIEVKAASIDTNNPKRDQHLRSTGFFNAKEFPTVTFKSNQVKQIDDQNYEVTGDLTLLGVTRPVTVKLERVGTKAGRMGYRTGFDATFTIKRSDFGMKFMLEGIGDEVRIMVGLESARK